MRNKTPPIQSAWRDYKKLYEKEQELLQFYSRMISGMELLWFLAPYILASFWSSSSPQTPVKKHTRRKHRNI